MTTLGQRAVKELVRGASRLFFGMTLRHVRHSCRLHLRGPLDDLLRSDEQFVLAAWHQDILPLFHYLINYTMFEKRRDITMLASRSFDGELTQAILEPWGFRFVRGSFGKKGARAAARGLRRALDEGRRVLVIADGPRPPPYVMRPGPVYLARATGVPLYVVRAWCRPQVLAASTWFKLAVPLPRAHIAVFSEGPIPVDGEAEAARLRAETTLRRLCEEADAHLYLRPRASGGTRLTARRV